jgi:hypothetical protein
MTIERFNECIPPQAAELALIPEAGTDLQAEFSELAKAIGAAVQTSDA